MEYLKTIGITCVAIGIYHLLVSRNLMRLIKDISRENRNIIRVLGDNIRTQGHILDRIEDLEDDVYLDDVSDSEDSDDENVVLPESSATNEV